MHDLTPVRFLNIFHLLTTLSTFTKCTKSLPVSSALHMLFSQTEKLLLHFAWLTSGHLRSKLICTSSEKLPEKENLVPYCVISPRRHKTQLICYCTLIYVILKLNACLTLYTISSISGIVSVLCTAIFLTLSIVPGTAKAQNYS